MIDKVIGACIGTAIGDALGMPAEGKKPETITRLYGTIKTYRTPRSARDGRPFHHNLSRGMWTDDTQLMLAIGESIVECGKIDYDDIADKHVEAYHDKRGWGRSTTQAVKNLMEGAVWYDAGVLEAAGNGPPMKIAPLGILYGLGCLSEFDFTTAVINISKMTHNDPRPAIAALIQAKLIAAGINSDLEGNAVRKFIEEHQYRGWRDFSSVLGDGDPPICEAIRAAVSINGCAPRYMLDNIGAKPFVNESCALTIAMVDKYLHSPELCLINLVNMGGDADTTGAMAGAILGATYGYKCFPKRWLRGLEDKKRIVNMAKGLYDLRENNV